MTGRGKILTDGCKQSRKGTDESYRQDSEDRCLRAKFLRGRLSKAKPSGVAT